MWTSFHFSLFIISDQDNPKSSSSHHSYYDDDITDLENSVLGHISNAAFSNHLFYDDKNVHSIKNEFNDNYYPYKSDGNFQDYYPEPKSKTYPQYYPDKEEQYFDPYKEINNDDIRTPYPKTRYEPKYETNRGTFMENHIQ